MAVLKWYEVVLNMKLFNVHLVIRSNRHLTEIRFCSCGSLTLAMKDGL